MMFSVPVNNIHSYDCTVQRFTYTTVEKELGVELIGPVYVLGTFQVVQTCDSVVIFCEEPVAEMRSILYFQ